MRGPNISAKGDNSVETERGEDIRKQKCEFYMRGPNISDKSDNSVETERGGNIREL